MLRDRPDIRYVCFLDDDLVLDSGFLGTALDFLDSEAGRAFGGIGGYDLVRGGTPFDGREILYRRLRLFDGPLRGGRWLYCGHFLELERLPVSDAVHESDFLGCASMWRREVFDHFRSPLALRGYGFGEDKHFSLRVRTKFLLGVHGGVRMWHLQAPSGRPNRRQLGYTYYRTLAILLRDCDADRPIFRYVAFLAFHFVDLFVQLGLLLWERRFSDFGLLGWKILGWLSCIVSPPRRTPDALGRERRLVRDKSPRRTGR
jgi:hypothetical protein